MNPPTTSWTIDALTGDEEQNGKKKKEKRKNREQAPPPCYSGPFGRLLRPEWTIRWAYSETLQPTGGINNIYMYIICFTINFRARPHLILPQDINKFIIIIKE